MSWDQSYSVNMCGLIFFFDTLELGPLEAYRAKIRKYATLYEGSQLWPLLHQADFRMRHERMEHLRRMGREATDKDATHPFDETNPWKWVRSAAVDGDEQWWRRELGDPAFFVLTKIRSSSSVVDGDPQAIGAPPTLKRMAEEALMTDGPPPVLGTADRQPKKPKQIGPSLVQISGGKYSCNKKGAELCYGFQDGSCTETKGGFCARASHRVRQCNLCLAQHPGPSRTKSAATFPAAENRKGKGKGK